MNGYKREAWEGFDSATDIQTQGAIVCHFLAREIKTVRDCIADADEKTGPVDNDKHLFASLVETLGWVADVTENEELKDELLETPAKIFHVALTADQFISLVNLSVTLHESMDGLKTIKDFEADDMSVGEAVECGFSGLEAVLGQMEW